MKKDEADKEEQGSFDKLQAEFDKLPKGEFKPFICAACNQSTDNCKCGPMRCPCGCCHSVDFGACQEFEEGANGRCVYCDHGRDCHPGDPNCFNTPLGVG